MSKCTMKQRKSHFTARAPLVALGLKAQKLGLFRTIGQHVQIAQKKVRYSPLEKLQDAFITILTGAKGLVEANKRLRPDRNVQAAFGRNGCAEQSVISATLDACTAANITQMEAAWKELFQAHSRAYRHDYTQSWQLLEVDMSGMPCGPKAAFATKGYFAKQRNRRGRQLGRVAATRYEEIVVDRLYDGKTQLPATLQELVQRAEEVLELDEAQRRRTLLRIDGHGGSLDDVNWMLRRGYQLHTKEYNGKRARRLAATVTTWHDDPRVAGRQVGWVTEATGEYVRPVQRVAVRTRKKNGQWGVGVVISTLSAAEALELARLPADRLQDPVAVLLAYVYGYDLRGGGIETELKEDKQGLGIHKRNKKRFAAQQMLVLLNALAHNLLVWAREWLTPYWERLQRYGILRLVRDVLHLRGLVSYAADGRICEIVLDDRDPLGPGLFPGLQALLAPLDVAVNLGEI
jgi:hypothetical protein